MCKFVLEYLFVNTLLISSICFRISKFNIKYIYTQKIINNSRTHLKQIYYFNNFFNTYAFVTKSFKKGLEGVYF